MVIVIACALAAALVRFHRELTGHYLADLLPHRHHHEHGQATIEVLQVLALMLGMALIAWLAFSDHPIPHTLEQITIGLATGTVGGHVSAIRNGVAKPLLRRDTPGAGDGS